MKKILFTGVFLIVTQILFGQTQFQMRYGSPYHDHAKKVIQTLDGNHIVVGFTNGFGSGGNAFIMKVNMTGTILWVKDYSGINADEITDIIELPNKKLVMCGGTYSYGAGSSDAFVMKTDSLGNLLWAKAYGGINGEYFFKISEDGANGFYATGYGADSTNTIGGSVIVNMDSVGNIVWAKLVIAPDGYPDMTPVASGGVILAQRVSPNTSFSLWKFSPSGNLIWSNNYFPTPNGSGLSGLSILENGNGEILVNFALANQYTIGQALDNFIIKLNSSGSLISDKSYGGTYSDNAITISNTIDGGIIICGVSNSSGNGDYDACLIKLSPNDSVQWAKAYGTVWEDHPSNVIQTSDGGYILTGQTWLVGTDYDNSKVHIVKTDSLGNTSCNAISWSPIVTNQTVSIGASSTPINFSFQQNNIVNWSLNNRYFYTDDICNPLEVFSIQQAMRNWNVYPNPFSETATIETTVEIETATFEMFDVLGQKVKQMQLTNLKSEITRENLVRGVYIYQIISETKVMDRGRIVIK